MREKIQTVTLLLLAFSLPFGFEISRYFLTLFILSLASRLYLERSSLQKPRNVQLILLLSLYIISGISMLYSEDKRTGLFTLEKQLSLLFLPFFFLFLPFKNELKSRVKDVFVAGNFIAAVACLLYGIYNSLSLSSTNFEFNPIVLQDRNLTFIDSFLYGGNYFSGSFLSTFIHPSYWSMYLVFCICILVDNYHKKENSLFGLKIQPFPLIIFFSLIIFLSSSKTGILSLLFVAAFYTLKLLTKENRWQTKLTVVVCVFALIGLAFNNPRLKAFPKQIWELSSGNKKETKDSTHIRLMAWEASFSVIAENLFWGVGIGDKQHALNAMYETKNLKINSKGQFNTHNQFLDTFLGLGIVGETLLLLFFISGNIVAWKRKSSLLFLFINLLLIQFLTESMLARYSGIVFVSLFSSLFFIKEAAPKTKIDVTEEAILVRS